MRALVDDCQDREFIQVRDTAIIRPLLDSGERLGKTGALTVGDVVFKMESTQSPVTRGSEGSAVHSVSDPS